MGALVGEFAASGLVNIVGGMLRHHAGPYPGHSRGVAPHKAARHPGSAAAVAPVGSRTVLN